MTPTPEAYQYEIITTPNGDIGTRFDYVINAGDITITMLIVAIALSVWFAILVHWIIERH